MPKTYWPDCSKEVVSGGLGQHQANVTLAMTEDLNKVSLLEDISLLTRL